MYYSGFAAPCKTQIPIHEAGYSRWPLRYEASDMVQYTPSNRSLSREGVTGHPHAYFLLPLAIATVAPQRNTDVSCLTKRQVS